MKAYSYTPFHGELESLKGPELTALKEVPEGWYVDYKESAPSIKDLAKHLSAFANQYGGWLFLGVKEKEDKGMTAGSFPGVPSSSIPSLQVSLREAVSAHLRPSPFFETRVIYGPVPELGLPSDRAVMTIGVPEGVDPPYIHSSGRIYRRVADQSDPKPETDRHVLDLLWGRSALTRQRLEDFLTDRPVLSKAETDGPVHAYVYFLADPQFVGHHFPLTYGDFASVMESIVPQSMSDVALPNTFTTPEGFIARHVADNDPRNELLTFRWWMNGNARVSIPINVHDFIGSKPHLDTLQLSFLEAIRKRGFKAGKIAEFSVFLSVLTAMGGKYLRLRKTLGITDSFFGKIRLYDTWRIIPFVNWKSYVKEIEVHGFPVVQDETLTCPPGLASNTLVEMNETEFQDNSARAFLTVLPLAGAALQGVGINFGSIAGGFNQEFIGEFSSAWADSLKQKPIR
ncbi:MAG: ATP-binding protein [Terriglobia bacterium]|jgi:hypothetical protein